MGYAEEHLPDPSTVVDSGIVPCRWEKTFKETVGVGKHRWFYEREVPVPRWE